jgi:dynein heavy chain 1
MEVLSQGAPNGVPPILPQPTTDPNAVVQHLIDVLQITLGALRKDLESVGSLLSKAKYSETIQRCTRFASESQVALYAQKDIAASDQVNGTDDGAGKSRGCLT